MAIPIKRFRIRKEELRKGQRKGFGEELHLIKDEAVHTIRLRRLDGGVTACLWGRIKVDADLPEGGVLALSVCAFDAAPRPRVDWQKIIGATDWLLYGQSGRYLCIDLEILGAGEGEVRQITVDTPGDPFLNTFPEIYREHGSFFHRYLSIFSSIYLDMQQAIDHLDEWIDVDTAAIPALKQMAGWLGIQVGDCALKEQALRTLVREAHKLNRRKGTRWAIGRVAAIALGRKVRIVERRCLLQTHMEGVEEDRGDEESDRKFQAIYDRLYGDSPYDFTILAFGSGSEEERDRLFALLEQFKPVESRASLVFLKPCSCLDSYGYLDINSRLLRQSACVLGRKAAVDEHYFMT